MRDFKAVIFDMDGVISDTQNMHAAVEEKMLNERGINISADEITKRFAGVSGKEMFSAIFSKYGKEADIDELVQEKRERVFEAAKGNIKEIPGTREFIEFLFKRNIPLAVASASRHKFIDLVLSELGLKDRFKTVVSSEDVKKGKPAPDIFLLAAEKMGVDPKKCIVVEDGVSGMIAARSAGMKCIGLVREDAFMGYPADLIVRDLRDVPSKIGLETIKYDKLVRDKIPEYIQSKGGLPIFHVADEAQYWQKLKEKLSEEVEEFKRDENIGELADILEVIDAIIEHKKFSKEDIEMVKNKKAEERGRFTKRIVLEEA